MSLTEGSKRAFSILFFFFTVIQFAVFVNALIPSSNDKLKCLCNKAGEDSEIDKGGYDDGVDDVDLKITAIISVIFIKMYIQSRKSSPTRPSR